MAIHLICICTILSACRPENGRAGGSARPEYPAVQYGRIYCESPSTAAPDSHSVSACVAKPARKQDADKQ
ncbi:hypothetical protein CNY67_05420 [Desulfovibrio sp. G11]|nr:hypothetical protein CNY67_05420 [Desulfovibrio sp. G11]